MAGPWSFGMKPINRASKESWDEIRKLAKCGKLDDIPADVYIKCYSTLKRIEENHLEPPETLPECRGIIIVGPPGTGKTSFVRETIPSECLYIKSRTKWWDGYTGQSVAVMDDLHPDHAPYLTSYIKDWTDRYAFKAEKKGGHTYPHIKQFIITT